VSGSEQKITSPFLPWMFKKATKGLTACTSEMGLRSAVFPIVQSFYLMYVCTCSPTNPNWARVVGCGPFSLWLIHKEGLCSSSEDINRLKMMMYIHIIHGIPWPNTDGHFHALFELCGDHTRPLVRRVYTTPNTQGTVEACYGVPSSEVRDGTCSSVSDEEGPSETNAASTKQYTSLGCWHCAHPSRANRGGSFENCVSEKRYS
jgi:hypothetical protein